MKRAGGGNEVEGVRWRKRGGRSEVEGVRWRGMVEEVRWRE